MNEKHKSVSKNKKEGIQKSLAGSEPSSTASSEAKRRPYLNTASDGRVTLTFPSSGGWSAQYHGPSPQPARYESITPASELSIAESNQPSNEKPVPLRLMTDESLAAVLDSNNTEHEEHSDSGSGDIEAWIESSRQTIIQQTGRGHNSQADCKS